MLLLVAGIVVHRSLLWGFPLLLGSLIRFKFPLSEEMGSPPDARCGAKCALCISFQNGHCSSCAFGDETLRDSCPIFVCAEKKETWCTECPEMLHCTTYREYADKCPFESPEVLQDTLPTGCGILVKEKSIEKSLHIFMDRIARGDLGLLILRQPPEVLTEWPQLESMPVVHLNQTVTNGNCLDPTNLAKLHMTIEEFFKAAPRSTVLLEGMEYLIVHNGIERMLKFAHSIAECASMYSSRFITIIDPRVLDDEELALLERELATITDIFERI